MENLDYSTEKWKKDPCPPINCHKKQCECGLEKVFLPSSLGDDSKDSPIAPKNGDYCNAIVVYESNGHVYIYSKTGIPTLVVTEGTNVDELIKELGEDLAQEVLDRKAGDKTLQDEIDEIKNSPDVVDIVATYAALQAYDTSKLGDNDIIRVLADETHDGDSTYYRWNKQTSTWVYVGAIHIDERAFKPFPASVNTTGTTQQFLNSILALNADTGMAYLGTVSLSDMPAGLVQEEVEVYIYNSYVVYAIMRSTDVSPYQWWCASYNYQGWQPVGGASNTIFYADLSESGATRHIYKSSNMTGTVSVQELLDANEAGQVILRMSSTQTPELFNDAYLQNTYVGTNDYQFLFLDNRNYYEYDGSTTADTTYYYSKSTIQLELTAGNNITITGNTIAATDTTYNNFIGTDGVSAGTSGLVPAPATTDDGKYLKADGSWGTVQAGPTVVQTTGNSTTSVMSQNATTSMVYSDPSTATKIQIGSGASCIETGGIAIGTSASIPSLSWSGTAIGNRAKVTAPQTIAIGQDATSNSSHSIAIGEGTVANHQYSVALGRNAGTTRQGEIFVGCRNSNVGYLNTKNRVIGGVYDGQLSNDAATLGQLNTRLDNLTLLRISQTDYDNLQSYDANTLYVITGA